MKITLKDLIERNNIDEIRKEQQKRNITIDKYKTYFNQEKIGGSTRLELMQLLWTKNQESCLTLTKSYVELLDWYKDVHHVVESFDDESLFKKIFKFECKRIKSNQSQNLDNIAFLYGQLLLHDLATVIFSNADRNTEYDDYFFELNDTISTKSDVFYLINGMFKLSDTVDDNPYSLDDAKTIEAFYTESMFELL